jgi:hypothetical protein
MGSTCREAEHRQELPDTRKLAVSPIRARICRFSQGPSILARSAKITVRPSLRFKLKAFGTYRTTKMEPMGDAGAQCIALKAIKPLDVKDRGAQCIALKARKPLDVKDRGAQCIALKASKPWMSDTRGTVHCTEGQKSSECQMGLQEPGTPCSVIYIYICILYICRIINILNTSLQA